MRYPQVCCILTFVTQVSPNSVSNGSTYFRNRSYVAHIPHTNTRVRGYILFSGICFSSFCFAKVADVMKLAWNKLKKLVIIFRKSRRLQRWPQRFRIRLLSSTHVLNCCYSIPVLVNFGYLCCIIVRFGFARHKHKRGVDYFIFCSWKIITNLK